ncbi:hypothetical protein BJX64DRAFT_169877 [Aspergillus heterothallicus]
MSLARRLAANTHAGSPYTILGAAQSGCSALWEHRAPGVCDTERCLVLYCRRASSKEERAERAAPSALWLCKLEMI